MNTTPRALPAPAAKRLAIYFEPRDIWIGLYVAPAAIYLCPLPTLVIRWNRAMDGTR